jgi:hypothetical protein
VDFCTRRTMLQDFGHTRNCSMTAHHAMSAPGGAQGPAGTVWPDFPLQSIDKRDLLFSMCKLKNASSRRPLLRGRLQHSSLDGV